MKSVELLKKEVEILEIRERINSLMRTRIEAKKIDVLDKLGFDLDKEIINLELEEMALLSDRLLLKMSLNEGKSESLLKDVKEI